VQLYWELGTRPSPEPPVQRGAVRRVAHVRIVTQAGFEPVISRTPFLILTIKDPCPIRVTAAERSQPRGTLEPSLKHVS
jgi:hypothetical protein